MLINVSVTLLLVHYYVCQCLYEKKGLAMMVFNSTNISKTNNQSPLILTELTEHNNDHDIRHCKSRSLGQAQTCDGVNLIPTLSSR